MMAVLIFLKNYWRETAIVILFLACFVSIRSCRTQTAFADLERSGKDSAYHYATEVEMKNGEVAYRVKTLEATVADLKNGAALGEAERRKLENENIKLGSLVAYYHGTAVANGTMAVKGKDSIVYLKDSTRQAVKTFKYDGQWLRLREIYNPITDSLSRRYQYHVDFNLISYQKPQGFFKRPQLVTDLTFTDPAIQVREFKGIIVKQPPKRFWETTVFKIGVGVVAGSYVTKKLSRWLN